MKKKSAILIVIGFIFLVAASVHTVILFQPRAIGQYETGAPAFPVGIAGTVRFQNKTLIPDGSIVRAENLNLGVNDTFATQNGRYAIGLSAYDGDLIKIQCHYNNLHASKTIIVDTNKKTHWANLTLGTEDQYFRGGISPLFIPAIIFIIAGVLVETYERKRKK